MAEMNTVVEGKVKYREGKKWKPRWCVLKKPSPVADRLQVLLYKDVKDAVKGGHPKSNFPLDGFYGLESGICYDKETSVLAIICHKQITLLAFESRETLIQFEIKIRRSLGEEHQFPVRIVKVPGQSKLPLDLVRMHIHGQRFCFTSCVPPKIFGSWNITDLRRFGIVDGKFCFEGGSRCGKGQGFHILQTDQAADVSEIIGLAGSGKVTTGKPYNSRRPPSKRRSEFLEPVKNAVSDNFFKNFQNAQVYADQNFQEDGVWPRPKRHSISFTDYRRAKTYAEKQRLMSIENVEKERLMAIYDIPPRRVRKVESVQTDRQDGANSASSDRHFYSNTMNERSCCEPNWTGECNNNVMSYQVPMTTIASNQSDATSSLGSMSSLQSVATTTTTTGSQPSNLSTFPMSSSAPALCGYGSHSYCVNKYREHSQSVPDQIAEEVDRIAGDAPREDFLHKLQQEEIDLQREMSLLDEILQVCRAEDVRQGDANGQPPPLPAKSATFRDILGSRGSMDNISISSDCTHSRPVPGGYSRSALLSPNLVNKLRLIHDQSKMNAPLRYVNLEKYDGGDTDTNHVHLPAASTSAPDANVMWADFASSRSKGYDNVPSNKGSNKENKRISVSLPGSRENLRNISGSDLQLNLPKDNKCYVNEPIYANEHRCETPPPELPPKGPILRSKQKRVINSASRPPPPPPRPPDRLHSLQQQKQDKLRLQYQSPRQGTNPVNPPSSPQEDNYFLMGNFDKEPNSSRSEIESQRLNESLSGRTVIPLPPKAHKSSKVDNSSCYMDMSGLLESENSSSFTETDSVKSDKSVHLTRPKYVRSLSASGAISKQSASPPSQQQQQQQLQQQQQPKYPPKRPESISVSAGNSPREVRREPAIREQNYMLMSSMMNAQKSVIENLQTLQTYVHTTPEGKNSVQTLEDGVQKRLEFDNGDIVGSESIKNTWYLDNVNDQNMNDNVCEVDNCEKPEIPFDNLLNFTLHHDSESASAVPVPPIEEKPTAETLLYSGKTPGFFTRLMRRNSKDRKSISLSQESLLYSTSSEPTIKEGMSILLESSSSGESSRSQSQQDLTLNPKDRSRSSSFPNRIGYIALNESTSSSSTGISVLSQQSDLGATNSSLSSGTCSTNAGSNECNLNCSGSGSLLNDNDSEKFSETEVKVKGNYENQSFLFVGPLENENSPDIAETNGSGNSESASVSASVDNTVEDDTDNNVDKNPNDNCGGKVFTVLSVQSRDGFQTSSKTDDEKLIELWHSTHSLNNGKFDKDTIAELKSNLSLPLDDMSPDQKANAIAKHIALLPPFVPPKTKSYPVKLSPVLEKRSKNKLNLSETCSDESPNKSSEQTPTSPMSPALMKQQAKATLRITPPSEDEHGKIWIPRTNEKPPEVPVDSPPVCESVGASLVVNVSDLGDQADDLSISSMESSCCCEDAVRSSPASTILRPRYGKEYQKIERRRTITDDSNTTSPLPTPQSPAGGSVFTFEMPFSATYTSSLSGYSELQSPKYSKYSRSEQASLSTGSESVQLPRAMYMNVDFTPPDSPGMPYESVPAEQLDPQLNYAEIDLTDTGRMETLRQQASKKYGKTMEPEPIEYSMIDMVATRAAQKAMKEHAQNRDGSLRRDRFISTSSAKERDRFTSTSSAKERIGSVGSSVKERVSSATLPTKAERKQAAACSAGQSTSSMESSMY